MLRKAIIYFSIFNFYTKILYLKLTEWHNFVIYLLSLKKNPFQIGKKSPIKHRSYSAGTIYIKSILFIKYIHLMLYCYIVLHFKKIFSCSKIARKIRLFYRKKIILNEKEGESDNDITDSLLKLALSFSWYKIQLSRMYVKSL